jgi:N-acetylglutamate synthase-like GNAT family acetyltransferase
MGNVRIEPFEPSDTEGVTRLILDIQCDEFGFAITAGDQPDLATIPAFYQSGAGGFWVAHDLDGKVVGTIGLKDIGEGRAALRKMFVAEGHRGGEMSVAKALLATLVWQAREAGLRQILLGTTDRFQAAHRFYERSGFERIDAADLPESFPRMEIDTRFYALRLDRG